MNKLKIILKYFLSFIFGVLIGGFLEDSFHKLIRQLYMTLTNNKISFGYPKFDILFFTFPFIISVGIYFMSLLYFFTRHESKQKVINTFWGLILFTLSIILYTYFDSNIRLIECTACDNGTMVLFYSDISYTKILIVTFITSLIPWAWTEIKARRITRQQTKFKASL